MSGQPSGRTFLATAIGYLATAAAVAVVPVILIKADARSEWFWYRIAWAEFLTLLCWSVAGFQIGVLIPARRRTGAKTGILPILSFFVVAYAILSLGAMIASAYLTENDVVQRWHLVGQIVLALGLVLLVVSLHFARQGASADVVAYPPGVARQEELALALKAVEDRFTAIQGHALEGGEIPRALRALKLLRERLEYSQVGKAVAIDLKAYEAIATGVRSLADQAEEVLKVDEKQRAVEDFVSQCRQLQDTLNNSISTGR